MKFLFSILFVIAVQYNLLAESTLPIHITMKSIKTDYIENGASGILISYYVDLRPYFTSTDYSNDTIKKVSISLSTELFKDNKHIKPSKGFENIYYKNKSHLIKKRNTIKLLKFSDYDFITKENALILYEFFVPYAAMNLENGNQNITFNTIATSYARNFKYSESKISNDVSFNKPFTKEVHIYIDSIVAVYGNWDLEILNKGAPDMTVKILVGDKYIFGMHKRDSYVIKARTYKNIIFTCSENDQFNINIEDIDLRWNDDVANLYFDLSDKKSGNTYLFNTPEQGIKSCNIEFTIK